MTQRIDLVFTQPDSVTGATVGALASVTITGPAGLRGDPGPPGGTGEQGPAGVDGLAEDAPIDPVLLFENAIA